MIDAWKQKQFAIDYAKNASNVDKNWYEYNINFPSMLAMMPSSAKRVLDYGCGPGEFTYELSKHFPEVDGADYSQEMINIASSSYPKINFFVWDNLLMSPRVEPYDAIFSKLTVHFINDLGVLAKAISQILKPGGVFIFSTTHPMSSSKKVDDYWTTQEYNAQIGSYGLQSPMIHRSFHDYIQPFISNGYSLQEICEPKVSTKLAPGFPPEKLSTPRCLNICFKKQ